MVWQDLAIMILNIANAYALIPQVYRGFKNKEGAMTLQTAAITTITVFTFAIIFSTMNLLLSSSLCTFNGIMWSILLMQRIKYGQSKSLKV
jgi:hypothetical protein